MKKKHLSNEEKEYLMKEFQNENCTKVQFCKKNKIGVTAFNSWIRKGKEHGQVDFLRIENDVILIPKSEEVAIKTIQLEVGSIKVILPEGTSSIFLGDLIKSVSNV